MTAPACSLLLVLLWVAAAAAQPTASARLSDGRSQHLAIGFDVGGVTAAMTTGNPYRPYGVGGGLALAVQVGTQLGPRLGLYYLNRTPIYLFADAMPGIGVAMDSFDFNSVVLNLTLRDNLTVGLGPSFDFMIPFSGNRAFGGGVNARVEVALTDPIPNDRKGRVTIGFDVHPSVLAYRETHGFYGFTKLLLVADLSIGVQWR